MRGGRFRILAKESAIYTLSGATRQLVGIVLVPVYTRVMVQAEVGAIDLLTNILALCAMVVMMGLDSAVGRYHGEADAEGQRRLASTTLLFLTGGGLLVAASGVLALGPLTRVLLDEPQFATALLLTLAAIVPTLVMLHCKNLLKWTNRAGALTWYSVSAVVLQTVLTIYLVVRLDRGVEGVALAAFGVSGVYALIGLWITRNSHGLVFDRAWLRRLLRFGTPLLPLALTAFVLTYADRYFLLHHHGLEVVGRYGIAYKIASAVSLLFMGFQAAFGPFVMANYRSPDAPALFARLLNYVVSAYGVCVLAVGLFARELVLVFAPPSYLDAAPAVPFVAASMAAYLIGGYFAFGATIAERTEHQLWPAGLAALVNIALNFALIPPFGLMGAAVATLLSYTFLVAVLQLVSQRFYRIRYDGRRILAFIAVLAALVCVAFFGPGAGGGIGALVIRVLAFGLGCLAPFVIGLVTWSDISDVLDWLRRTKPAAGGRDA